MASLRHSWPSFTTYNPILVSAYLSWTYKGNITYLPPRGTLPEPPNHQQYAQINSFSSSPNTWLVWGTQGTVSPPNPCLSLPQLELGGESHPPATQGDPTRAPKRPANDQQSFSLSPNTWVISTRKLILPEELNTQLGEDHVSS